jgi:hypothetical protein
MWHRERTSQLHCEVIVETPSTDAALTRRNLEDYVFDARTMPWDTLHPVDGTDNQIDISRYSRVHLSAG